jgi:hypothetical protein
MGIWAWICQNWFNLFSAITVIAGLWFTAFSLRADTRTRRIANLLTITANHREVWNKILLNPELKRVLNPAADPVKQPVNDEEEIFVSMVIHHINSVYYALSDHLVVKYEGLRRDISEFLSLPIPKAVWEKSKKFQNDDFVAFVESGER